MREWIRVDFKAILIDKKNANKILVGIIFIVDLPSNFKKNL
jgi:hypothetical protein